MLGGSAQQVIAIETAKKLGYYTVLCDYLTDNPGQYVADKFYLLSTTDKEAILKVAYDEKVDGVIAYASDPAAPTAAYVAEKLGLPGNPYKSVEILCNKDKFREFLLQNDFCVPKAKGYKASIDAERDIRLGYYNFPIIIKPVDSSGSKGATVINNIDSKNIEEAIRFAFSFSRSKCIVIEEFIEKKHQYLIGGDVFVSDGKIVLWGLMNCHRDNKVNNLVPVGKSYPPDIEENDLKTIKDTLSSIVQKLDIKDGAMNVEFIVDKTGKAYPIDIGPRNGGNMIPDLLGYIFDVDVVEMSIKSAMGLKSCCGEKNGVLYYATHNLHSAKNGILDYIEFSELIEKHIIKKCIYKKKNDTIEFFDNASKALGVVFMKFENVETMNEVLNNINDHIKIQFKI